MMGIKSFIVILVTVSLTAYICIRIFEDELFKEETETCLEGNVCVRFCCNEPETCSNKSHFYIHYKKNETRNLPEDFKVIQGTCRYTYGENATEFLVVTIKH